MTILDSFLIVENSKSIYNTHLMSMTRGSSCELPCRSIVLEFNDADLYSKNIDKQLSTKRYCYFDRVHGCNHHSDNACQVDNRPCNADRSYLDHIYGPHYYPTLATMHKEIYLKQNEKESSKVNDIKTQFNDHLSKSSQRQVYTDNEDNSPSSLRLDNTVSENNKRNQVTPSSWIEYIKEFSTKFIVNFVVALLTLLFSSKLSEKNGKSNYSLNN